MSTHTDAHDIQKEVKTYLMVFAALAFLTVVTVAISYLHLSTGWAIVVAMIVATIKGALVACYFMHLISEKMFVYVLLIFTVIFIMGLFTLPLQYMDQIRGTQIVP